MVKVRGRSASASATSGRTLASTRTATVADIRERAPFLGQLTKDRSSSSDSSFGQPPITISTETLASTTISSEQENELAFQVLELKRQLHREISLRTNLEEDVAILVEEIHYLRDVLDMEIQERLRLEEFIKNELAQIKEAVLSKKS
jgi:hypothetical protein